MRVIFLDIDGVLNSAAWYDQRGPRPVNRPLLDHSIDPAAITRLNRLCDATGAQIVISSTWRHGTTARQFQEDFAYLGCTGRIIGRTPDLSNLIPRGTRGEEIATWLQLHGKVTTFVILDDDNDMGALSSHLVQTSHETGLTDADVDRAITLLNSGN